MKNGTEDQLDKLIKHERRGIWLALTIVLALTTALVANETRQVVLATIVPMGIVIGAAWVNRGTRGDLGSSQAAYRELIAHDELRQVATGRAYKWAFLMVLCELLAYSLASIALPISLSGQMVALLAVATGAAAFLACFLLFDRV